MIENQVVGVLLWSVALASLRSVTLLPPRYTLVRSNLAFLPSVVSLGFFAVLKPLDANL